MKKKNDKIRDKLKEKLPEGQKFSKLILTGHSLGGAAASILMALLFFEQGKQETIEELLQPEHREVLQLVRDFAAMLHDFVDISKPENVQCINVSSPPPLDIVLTNEKSPVKKGERAQTPQLLEDAGANVSEAEEKQPGVEKGSSGWWRDWSSWWTQESRWDHLIHALNLFTNRPGVEIKRLNSEERQVLDEFTANSYFSIEIFAKGYSLVFSKNDFFVLSLIGLNGLAFPSRVYHVSRFLGKGSIEELESKYEGLSMIGEAHVHDGQDAMWTPQNETDDPHGPAAESATGWWRVRDGLFPQHDMNDIMPLPLWTSAPGSRPLSLINHGEVFARIFPENMAAFKSNVGSTVRL